jgi:acetoin utilization protein AcuB
MLKVADIMTRDPVTVRGDTTLGEVIGLMKSHACRQLPVVEGGRLVGIITDRDIRLAMNSPLVLHERADDRALLNTAIAETCMTTDPMTVDADAPARTAAELLKKYKFGGLPVLKEGQLVGIISISDVLSSYIVLLGVEAETT